MVVGAVIALQAAQARAQGCEVGQLGELEYKTLLAARAAQAVFDATRAYHYSADAQLGMLRGQRQEVREPGEAPASWHVEGSVLYGLRELLGFELCDGQAQRAATLRAEELAFQVGVRYAPYQLHLAFVMHAMGSSVLQSDLERYRPSRDGGAQLVDVPGARGWGHTLLGARLGLGRWLALSFGSTLASTITHQVGWFREVDEDGARLVERDVAARTGIDGSSRAFVSLDVPKLRAGVDFAWASGSLFERPEALSFGLRDLPLTLADRLLVVDGGAAYSWRESQPFAWLGAALPLPLARDNATFALGVEPGISVAADLAQPRVRELRLAADLSIDGFSDQVAWRLLSLRSALHLYNSNDLLRQTGESWLPGVQLAAALSLPLLFVAFELEGWIGTNRPETLAPIPFGSGRFELGTRLMMTARL